MFRWFPDHRIAHQCRSATEVCGNGSEIEGRDGINVALERTVIDMVPDSRGIDGRLLAGDLFEGVMVVEAEEVNQLTGRIDLRLEDRLGLAEHR